MRKRGFEGIWKAGGGGGAVKGICFLRESKGILFIYWKKLNLKKNIEQREREKKNNLGKRKLIQGLSLLIIYLINHSLEKEKKKIEEEKNEKRIRKE